MNYDFKVILVDKQFAVSSLRQYRMYIGQRKYKQFKIYYKNIYLKMGNIDIYKNT